MTNQEQVLKNIAKAINALDDNSLGLQFVDAKSKQWHNQARNLLWSILNQNGYEITQSYKLVKSK